MRNCELLFETTTTNYLYDGMNPVQELSGTSPTANLLTDQMQNRGIPPSAVKNALDTGVTSGGNTAGTTVTYDPVNNISVVTNSNGEVVTVRYGGP